MNTRYFVGCSIERGKWYVMACNADEHHIASEHNKKTDAQEAMQAYQHEELVARGQVTPIADPLEGVDPWTIAVDDFRKPEKQ